MAAELLTDASRALDANASPYSGATWRFYLTGTLTPANVFSDAGLSVSLGSVVTADAGGKFVPIYFDATKQYRGILTSADGATTIYDIDPINSGIMMQLSQGSGGALVGVTARRPSAPTRTILDKSQDVYNIFDEIPAAEHNAIIAGVSTYDATADIQTALDYLDVTAGAIGGVLHFPNGVVNISETINQRNWTSIRGLGRSSQIHALPGFTGTEMIRVENPASPDPISMFSVPLDGLFFDGKGNVDNIIHAYAWQENGGIRHCAMQGFNLNGILIERGDGGASWTMIQDCEIFGTEATSEYGIRVDQVLVSGAFMLHVDGASITGSVGNSLPSAIYVRKDSLNIRTLHIEHADWAVLVEGTGNHILDGVTGGPGVTSLIGIDSTFTGTLVGRALNPNGATGFTVQNFVTGENIAASEGMVAEYSYPNYNFEASVGSQIANVTGNGTNYTVVFGTERHDIGGWYNNANGIATAPKSGRYQFDVHIKVNCPLGVTILSVALVTTGRTYTLWRGSTDSVRDSGNFVTISGSQIAKMAATDTARVVVTATGLGADTIDVEATESIFSGAYLYR